MRRFVPRSAISFVLAFAVCAPAHSAAFLKLTDVTSEPRSTAGGREQHIDLLSYSFGKDQASGEMTLKGSKIGQNSFPGYGGGARVAVGDVTGDSRTGPGASQNVTVGGSQTESGQATGKYLTLRPRPHDRNAPSLGPGTLTVKGSFPGCTVGKRYPRAQLGDGSVRFVMDGVVVTSCGGGSAMPTESISFNYSKIKY